LDGSAGIVFRHRFNGTTLSEVEVSSAARLVEKDSPAIGVYVDTLLAMIGWNN
jgi:hypothetical protein